MKLNIQNKKDIIDRRQLVLDLEAASNKFQKEDLNNVFLTLTRPVLKKGINEVRARLETESINGLVAASSISYLVDQIIRIAYDFTLEKVYPIGNPTDSEKISLIALGGYGRGEMAPFSDVDLMFLVPYKRNPWVENVVEYLLYLLWDLGLKVGHSIRSVKDCIRLSKEDLIIRTSLMDARYIWGDQALFTTGMAEFKKKIIAGSSAKFFEEKMKERADRHIRVGDSRFVVEPNLKDGKGGLRDLQTLFWLAKNFYGIKKTSELVDLEVISSFEAHAYERAMEFLWHVRCHLHYISGRAEERLTFDAQRDLAGAMGYKDSKGLSGVETFMKHYFLVVKEVGTLTRVFCASLEDKQEKKKLFGLSRFGLRKKVGEFQLDGGRLKLEPNETFKKDPLKLLKIFLEADRQDLDIHPDTMRAIRQNLGLIDKSFLKNEAANEIFLQILTSMKKPGATLQLANEAGVLGRFVPDFGKVVAQMQHDMYHHYTVDEHTINAIKLLSRIEKGKLKEDHPIATREISRISSRRALYVAVFLHDIAKGRGGDHSLLGAEVAKHLCPRLGMSASETELVSWLVKEHLLLSNTAFKRDLSDPKTIEDFISKVQSPERLRLLTILTVVDIRAVGPGIWNAWKRQLIGDLFMASEEALIAGHMEHGRSGQVHLKKEALRERLASWTDEGFDGYVVNFPDSYWVAEETDVQERNADLIAKSLAANEGLRVSVFVNKEKAMTKISVYTQDKKGVFSLISGAFAILGANVVDAKIFTTKNGMALENFAVQNIKGEAFDDPNQLERLKKVIQETVLKGISSQKKFRKKTVFERRTAFFKVEPIVLFDNNASNRYTVLEINARDRVGLLFDLTRVLSDQNVTVESAHIATYGERAVDVFYIMELDGRKITNGRRLKSLTEKLLLATKGIINLKKTKLAKKNK